MDENRDFDVIPSDRPDLLKHALKDFLIVLIHHLALLAEQHRIC